MSEVDSVHLPANESWHRRSRLKRLIMPLLIVTTGFTGVGALFGWVDAHGDQGVLDAKKKSLEAFQNQAAITKDMIEADNALVSEGCRVAAKPFITGDQSGVDDLAAAATLHAPEVCGPGAMEFLVRIRRDERDLAYNQGKAEYIKTHELPGLEADAASESEVWQGALLGAALGVAIVGFAARS